MTTKTNAEFIAECEALLEIAPINSSFNAQHRGPDAAKLKAVEQLINRIPEAIERLKAAEARRCNYDCDTGMNHSERWAKVLEVENIHCKTCGKNMHLVCDCTENKEIAELKELLRWATAKIKGGAYYIADIPHGFQVVPLWDHIDCPEKQRIEQILSTPSEGNEDGKEKAEGR